MYSPSEIRMYRVYFNRAEDAPQVCSVDEGSSSSEINVIGVHINVPSVFKCNLTAMYPEPKAWLEATGVLRITGGNAHIERGLDLAHGSSTPSDQEDEQARQEP